MSTQEIIGCVIGSICIIFLLFPNILKKKEKKEVIVDELHNRRKTDLKDVKISTVKIIKKDPSDRRIDYNPHYGGREGEVFKRKQDIIELRELRKKYEKEMCERE